MPIFKKIVGVFLLVLSALLGLSTLLNFISEIGKVMDKKAAYTSYELGYTVGSFVALLLIALLVFFLAKFSLKLMAKKEAKLESVDEIGKPT